MSRDRVRLKRVYDQAEADDGKRYLVDRIWPRGISKAEAKLDGWLKDLAPSDELRKWYAHDPARWGEFRRRYRLELEAKAKQTMLGKLAMEQRKEMITLLYAARDQEHNNAVVLREELSRYF